MTSRDFAFWCNGFFELTDAKTLNEKQTELIKKHLALVFFHEIDPSYSDDPKIQEQMNNIHAGEAEPVELNETFIPEVFPHNKITPHKSNSQTIYRC